MKTDGPPSRYWAAISGCAGLALLLTPAFVVCAAVGWQQSGSAGVTAAALAAGICGLGAIGALLLTARLTSGRSAVVGALLGTLLRTAIPLVGFVAVPTFIPALRDAGFAGMLLGCYLLTLAGETWLAARLIRSLTASDPAQAA